MKSDGEMSMRGSKALNNQSLPLFLLVTMGAGQDNGRVFRHCFEPQAIICYHRGSGNGERMLEKILSKYVNLKKISKIASNLDVFFSNTDVMK